MAGLFLKLVNMSITAGWIVVAVIILRFVLKKAPKWVSCLLWALVGVRLALPYSLESMLSLIPSAETLPDKVITGNSFKINSGVALIDTPVNSYLGDRYFEGVTVPAYNGFNTMTVLGLIWVAGIVIMLTYGVISYLKIKRKTAESIKIKDNIYLCDKIDTPFILGLISPKIYLPFDMADCDRQYVIAHETAHLKRLDHIWKPLGFALLSVHWFNPLIWVGYILLCRDIELACDEKVIGEQGAQFKKPYSEALINCSVPRRMIAACPLAFGEVGVKGRIKSVLNYKKPTFWIIIAGVIAIIAASVTLLTNPKSPPKTPKPSSSDTQSAVSSDVTAKIPQLNTTAVYFYSKPLNYDEIRSPKVDNFISKAFKFSDNQLPDLLQRLKGQQWMSDAMLDIYYEFDGFINYNKGIYFSLNFESVYYDGYVCTADKETIFILKDYLRLASDYQPDVVLQGGSTDVTDLFDVQVSYANSARDKTIYSKALNSSKIDVQNPNGILPIYRFDSLKNLNDFKEKFKDKLTMDNGYDEMPSFNSVTAQYDNKFFDENALFLVYVEATSGSYRYNAHSIYNDGKEFKIAIHKVRNPEVYTEDMAGWFVTVGIKKDAVKTCTDYNAYHCK